MTSSPAALRLRVFPEAYSVCRIASASGVNGSGRLTFLSRTDEELSLVCESAKAPADALAREDGWRALRVEGVLDFSLIGILSRLTAALAAKKIPVFCVSTYNTDYLLVKEETLAAALRALEGAGCEIAS